MHAHACVCPCRTRPHIHSLSVCVAAVAAAAAAVVTLVSTEFFRVTRMRARPSRYQCIAARLGSPTSWGPRGAHRSILSPARCWAGPGCRVTASSLCAAPIILKICLSNCSAENAGCQLSETLVCRRNVVVRANSACQRRRARVRAVCAVPAPACLPGTHETPSSIPRPPEKYCGSRRTVHAVSLSEDCTRGLSVVCAGSICQFFFSLSTLRTATLTVPVLYVSRPCMSHPPLCLFGGSTPACVLTTASGELATVPNVAHLGTRCSTPACCSTPAYSTHTCRGCPVGLSS